MTQTIDLEEMKRIYAEPNYGYTDAELADRFGTTRSAIYKARKRLEDSGIEFIQTERGRYRIDRRRFVSNIRVSTPEALVLYVAARKLSRHTGFTHKHVQNALDKLSYALYQPMTEKLVKA
ncbi:MAG: helix-turn-helix domain-containing protein, partial [Calditrichaeota bacterium]